MAPSSATRLAAASEPAARRARRLTRTIDLQHVQMAEDGDRDGEGEAEGVVEAEAGVEEDAGAPEPGIFHPYEICHLCRRSLSASGPLHFFSCDTAKPTSKVLEPSLSHLREISSLASWTVSTYKPGCGIPALLAPSTSQFWQSDGPQPHLLNIHFFKLVHIVKLRVFLDFTLDESYTPTRMLFLAGMGMYDLTEFTEWIGEEPKGWVDVPLEGVGGGDDGNVLRAMVVQIRVCENHQNGKDTHVRGVQVFAMDERGPKGVRRRGLPPVMGGEEPEEDTVMDDVGVARTGRRRSRDHKTKNTPTAAVEPGPVVDEATRSLRLVGLEEPDWMGEPEVR